MSTLTNTPKDPTATEAARTPDELRAAIDVALAQPSLPAAFQVTARAGGDRVALRRHDGTDEVTWSSYLDRVRRAAGGLDALGVGVDDAVAFLAGNVPLFNVVDTAAMHLGAVPYSIYPTEPLGQMIDLVTDAGARVIVAESAFLDRALEIARTVPAVETVVVLDDDAPADTDGVVALTTLGTTTRAGFDFDATWRAVGPEQLAALIYTSGTTGLPKGVQLSHRAIMASLRGVDRMAPARGGGRGLSFLPAAHIVDRFVCHYSSIALGGTLTCVPDPADLWDAIAATRPTRFFGVPRTWEKLAERATAIVGDDPGLLEALETGRATVRAEQAGDAPPEAASAAREALAPVRAALGLDDAEWLAVAAAPSSLETLTFHHALGFDLLELWGMSEFIMAIMNPPGRVRLGSVGVPLPEVEVSLADDGELLLRGPHRCSGYRGNDEATAGLTLDDGWVATGDLATVDAEGFVRIVGRKKEKMINSSGKNLFPVKIETAIGESSPLLAWVAAIGDRRRYVTALIVLDPQELQAFAAGAGLSGDHATLTTHPLVRAEVQRVVDIGNAQLSRVEHVRAFSILPDVWEPGDDVVTNTMKLRRTIIAERYADDVEALYAS